MGKTIIEKPMTLEKMTTEEMLNIINDFKNGYRIMRREIGKAQWLNVDDADIIHWNFEKYQYLSKKPTKNICVNVSIPLSIKQKLEQKLMDEDGEINFSGHFSNDLRKIIFDYINNNEELTLFNK